MSNPSDQIILTEEQIEADLEALYKLLNARDQHKRENLIDYMWNEAQRNQSPVHMEFIKKSKEFDTMFLSAANRSGKSLLLSFIIAVHATNKYPDWWEGRRFKKCTFILVIAPDYNQMRQGIQKYLVGSYEAPGTGLIPKDTLIVNKCKKQQNVANVFKILVVDRADQQDYCTIEFFSGDGSPGAIAGLAPNLIVIDEPCRPEIWREAQMRIMTVDCGGPTNEIGQILINFTSVNEYWRELFSEIVPTWQKPVNNITSQGTYVLSMTMFDVPDFILSKEAKAKMEQKYKGSIEYESRILGWPSPGAGAVFPYDSSIWTCDDFPIPSYWPKFYGLDYGQKNTAVVCLAYDPTTETYYAYNEWAAYDLDNATNVTLSLRDTVYQISHVIKGTSFGVFDPSSAGQPVVMGAMSRGSGMLNDKEGKTLIGQFQALGLNIVSCPVRNVALKIEKLRDWVSTGQLKVFKRACKGTINEFKTLMYDEEKRIVKRNDHKVDAVGYAALGANRLSYYTDDPGDSGVVDCNSQQWRNTYL